MDEMNNTTFDFMGKSKNVLYLSYDGMTDPLGQSQVLPYLIGLSREGFIFHIISFEKQHRFETHKDHIQKICDQNNIIWHPNSYTQKSPLITTIWDVYRMKKLTKKLHTIHAFHIIHCRSYIAALVGLYMKQSYKTKFVFDMRGFWADERIDGGLWSLKNPVFKVVYKYFKKKELKFFKNADYTISLTQNGRDEILSWNDHQKNPPKIQIIPCCVDLNLFDPLKVNVSEKNLLKKQLKLEDSHYVLGYVGSIGTWYMLPEMLDYFIELKKIKSNAKFVFVTGENPDKIHQEVNRKNIEKEDIIITSCLHKDVPINISMFDLSVFFIRPTFSKKASSPTKQGEIMAMGIPLICNSGVGDTDIIVSKNNAGSIITDFSREAYIESILHPVESNIISMKKGAEDFYSLKNGIEKYIEVYKYIYRNER